MITETQNAASDGLHSPSAPTTAGKTGSRSESGISATSASLARVEVDSVLLPSRNEGDISDDDDDDDNPGTIGCSKFNNSAHHAQECVYCRIVESSVVTSNTKSDESFRSLAVCV